MQEFSRDCCCFKYINLEHKKFITFYLKGTKFSEYQISRRIKLRDFGNQKSVVFFKLARIKFDE